MKRMSLMPLAMVAALFLTLGAPQALAQQSPHEAGASIGQAIYNLTHRKQLREQNEMEARMRAAEIYSIQQETRENAAQATLIEQLIEIRRGLRERWKEIGFDDEHANALAQAYNIADDDKAVFLSVRGQPARSVGDDIRQAIASRNYQLANQLLLGYLLAQEAAKKSP